MNTEKHTPNRREITDWIGNQRITWCGPYALAVVAGCTYEKAYQTVKHIRRKRHCKGITVKNFVSGCKALGIKTEYKKLERKTKLSKFWDMHLAPNKVYVVHITKHFLTIDTRDMLTIDNQNPEWIRMELSKHKNKMVHGYCVIENPNFEPEHENMELPLAASS